MFKQTGVDGIMIGRASIGKPWIFRQIKEYINKEEITETSDEEKLKIILEHIELQVKYLGESTGIKEMRKYMNYYLKNMPNATQMRQKINQIETKKELQESIIKYFETYKA